MAEQEGFSGDLGPATRWESIPGAFRYDVYLGTSNPPAKIVAADVEAISYAPVNLQPITAYHWKVVAKANRS